MIEQRKKLRIQVKVAYEVIEGKSKPEMFDQMT